MSRLLPVTILILLCVIAWQLASVLLLLFGGIIVATALRLIAERLEPVAPLPLRGRVILSLVLIALSIAAFVWLVGDRVSLQIDELRARLPAAVRTLRDWLGTHPSGQSILEAWHGFQDGEVPWPRIWSAASITLSALGGVVLVIFTGIFLALDTGVYRRGLLQLVPPRHRHVVGSGLDATGTALRHWLFGQAISMVFVGLAMALGLLALGVPLAMTLGLLSGVLGFVPFFGAIAAGVLAVLVAFAQGPQQAAYVTVLAIAVQQIEGHLLTPLVQRWAVALPPVLGIMAGVAFGVLFGVIGVVFATPLMVVVTTLIDKLYVEAYLEGRHPVTSGSGSAKC